MGISATTVTTTLDQPSTTTTRGEHSPACDAHPRCSGLAGDCCPTSVGLQLGCCDQIDSSTTATTVATATITTTATTTGPAPTTGGPIATIPTSTTTTLIQPSTTTAVTQFRTTTTRGEYGPACDAHPRCSGLAG